MTPYERRLRALAQLSMIQTLAGALADAARDVRDDHDNREVLATWELDGIAAIQTAAENARDAARINSDRLILDLSAA